MANTTAKAAVATPTDHSVLHQQERDRTAAAAAADSDMVVFVRGTGRCGSRTLVRLLGEHQRLARVPVNEVLPEALIEWSRWCLPEDVAEEALAAACRAYFTAYGRALAGRPGALLQKSTMNAHQLDALLRFWPRARLIYLVRHPIGVVQSMLNVDINEYRGRHGRATVANALLRWYNDVLAYLRSAAFGHPRALLVRFEDLIADAAGSLAAIHRFLGLETQPYPAAGGPGPDRYGDRFVLDTRERRWIIESTADVVHRLGYDPQQWSDAVAPPDAALLSRHGDRRLRSVPPALDGVELLRLALEGAQRCGYRRAGLFGAGYFARLVCPRLERGPVEVVCVCDDDPMLTGRRLAGIPICRPEQAAEHGAEVSIPMTFVHQAAMLQRWRRLLGDTVPIRPLWDEQASSAATPEPQAEYAAGAGIAMAE